MNSPNKGRKAPQPTRVHPKEMDMTHALSNEAQMEINGRWVSAIPYPLFVTTGLPFWKRPFEKYWRPQCNCSRIFETLEDYNAHVVYKNSPYRSL